jgi:two-component system, chemotaxis family, sensor kinase Cph1
VSQALRTAPDPLEECAREPIHIPGSIQPHGMLLALDPGPELRLLAASANTATLLGRAPRTARGTPMRELIPGTAGEALAARLALSPGPESNYLNTISLERRGVRELFHAIAHQTQAGTIILELEPTAEEEIGLFEALYPMVRGFMSELQGAGGIEELCHVAAAAVRDITGFDRVLVYRFDAEWNGEVIAEQRNDRLPSYLGLRFPASDIPAQARELYRINRMRLIADCDYEPVPIEPAADPGTGEPLDLSFSVLRSVSPVHLEYMRNMGTGASMSVSLLHEGQLWGLLSCHHREPRRVPFQMRSACDLLGQILSLQISAREQRADAERRIALRSIEGRLLAAMAAEENFVDGLLRNREALLALTGAAGVAVIDARHIDLVGTTPTEPEVRALADWVGAQPGRDLLHTDELALLFPPAAAYGDRASGLLAVSISQIHASYVLWFRPELAETVRWAGDPRKSVEPGATRLHPRKSFETWMETVRGRARSWSSAELAAAQGLRRAVVDIVLRRAEELAALADELRRSNRELESFSYSVSHDLRAPFRHIVGYAELLRDREGALLTDIGRRYIDKVIEAGGSAGTLVDNLLSFSRMARAELRRTTVDMDKLVQDVLRRMEPDLRDRAIEWRIGPLGRVEGDVALLRVLVENLVANAVKFTRGREPAKIEISRNEGPDATVFVVRDNGTGFDMAYANKLFGVFQRLHRVEEFEGTGIGLANVRRIIERHGGQSWAEGALGQGASFYFSFPRRPAEDEHERTEAE